MEIKTKNHQIQVVTLNTVVVGSGAAALNAAIRLHSFGEKNIAVVTDQMNNGTSRNSGSDKQTYYKLTLAGDGDDSVYQMAKTLFDGGAMDGDIALCEAALSARSFYHLVELGVPFPHNAYGEYVGYKTDHDPRQRATSAGPLTSKMMTNCLQAAVTAKGIPVYDNCMVIKVVTDRKKCLGVLCLNKNELKNKSKRYIFFCAKNTVYGTGAPAGIYSQSVYPITQNGGHGVAFEAGVMGKNLTEWQYGLASTKFRWNLSGTYQQVLPCYISTDQNGNDEKEFLRKYFDSSEQMLNAIFLKGYQWPFDPKKTIHGGSSLVDIAVYNEIHKKNRRVFLDFKRNSAHMTTDFSNVGNTCYQYLSLSNALLPTPIERLKVMNQPAIDLYLSHDIDLFTEKLEINVCAQHNNGGLTSNAWWESNIKNFFPIGEANGTHGIYRPGGSALNSGQCGGLRAAQFINLHYKGEPNENEINSVIPDIEEKINQIEQLQNNVHGYHFSTQKQLISERMSKYAAFIRNESSLQKAFAQTKKELDEFWKNAKLEKIEDLPDVLINYDLLVTSVTYLFAMIDYIKNGGKSRGSFLIESGSDESDTVLCKNNSDNHTFILDKNSDTGSDLSLKIQEILYTKNSLYCTWRDVRPLPKSDDWFELVYNKYLNNEIT